MKTIKKSVVKNVQGNGTWNNPKDNKLFYKWQIEMENGDTGGYLSVTDQATKFPIGQEVEYEYDTSNQTYPRIKPAPTGNFGGGGNYNKDPKTQEYIIRQSSLKCATDLVIANGGNITTILNNADIFTKWVQTGQIPVTNENNDLPF